MPCLSTDLQGKGVPKRNASYVSIGHLLGPSVRASQLADWLPASQQTLSSLRLHFSSFFLAALQSQSTPSFAGLNPHQCICNHQSQASRHKSRAASRSYLAANPIRVSIKMVNFTKLAVLGFAGAITASPVDKLTSALTKRDTYSWKYAGYV